MHAVSAGSTWVGGPHKPTRKPLRFPGTSRGCHRGPVRCRGPGALQPAGPGASVPLTSQGAWLHLRPEDNGGRGSSLCVSSARASLEESSVSPGMGVLGRGAPRFSWWCADLRRRCGEEALRTENLPERRAEKCCEPQTLVGFCLIAAQRGCTNWHLQPRARNGIPKNASFLPLLANTIGYAKVLSLPN